jgi:hypothetical protein
MTALAPNVLAPCTALTCAMYLILYLVPTVRGFLVLVQHGGSSSPEAVPGAHPSQNLPAKAPRNPLKQLHHTFVLILGYMSQALDGNTDVTTLTPVLSPEPLIAGMYACTVVMLGPEACIQQLTLQTVPWLTELYPDLPLSQTLPSRSSSSSHLPSERLSTRKQCR